MAKKKTSGRRVPRSATPRTFGDGRPSQDSARETAPDQVAVAPRTNGAPARAGVRPAAPELRRRVPSARSMEARPQLPLREEYGYVPGDLKRLGILTGGMVALMLVLGLIIH